MNNTLHIGSARPANILHVCKNLRPKDETEALALRFYEDPECIAAELIKHKSRALIIHDLRPSFDAPAIALLGAFETWPGVVEVFMLATPAWPEIAKPATRWVREWIIPYLTGLGLHAAHCWVKTDHLVARRWLEHLGAEQISDVPCWGKNRETFTLYQWR